MELMAGAIDIFPYLTDDQANQLPDTYQIAEGSMNLVQALFLNNAAEPFNDVKVRQAICYALDRQGILDMVAGGRGTVIDTNMFPGFTKYYNSDLKDTYAYNTEKSKELLCNKWRYVIFFFFRMEQNYSRPRYYRHSYENQ